MSNSRLEKAKKQFESILLNASENIQIENEDNHSISGELSSDEDGN